MDSLLTPSESHAFQCFLSSLDVSAPEWAHYTVGTPNPDDIIVDVPVPHAHGREALTKATKELMDLDTDCRNSSSADFVSCRRQQLPTTSYDYQHRQIGDQQPHPQRQTSLPFDSFPYMNCPRPPSFHRPQQAPILDPPYSDSHHLRPLIVPLSIRTNRNGVHSNSSSTSAASTPTTPNGTTPIYAVSPDRQATSNVSESMSIHQPSRSKKQNGQGSSDSTSTQKATLLSPSQKKANHIRSEQKRRANIRRGYDALCDTVPSLREAIREEEEREAEARANRKSNGRNGTAKRAGKKRDSDFTDKADGRAGPRSENIILSKTIDYINELLSERQALLNRMQRAQGTLPLGHPALVPSVEQPLWEMEWKGGEGKYDAKNETGEEEEEEEEIS